MTEKTKAPTLPMADALAEFVEVAEVVVLGQTAAMAVLGAEMKELAEQFASGHAAKSPEDLIQSEVETEASFDNMPL